MSNNLKILACFKIVADMDAMTNGDWHINDGDLPAASFVKKALSSGDESVLETALKLAEELTARRLTAELTALTIGDKTAESFLKTMYALNYDKAVCVTPESRIDLRFNPRAIATIIGEYRNRMGQHDVIILGNQSDDGQNGQTPFLLAEYLRWPCIARVSDIAVADSAARLTITSHQDGKTLTQRINAPVVLALDNVPAALRIPTLKNKLNAAKKQPQYYTPAHLSLSERQLDDSNDKKLIALVKPDNSKTCLIIEGADAKEKAHILYHRYLKPRLRP